MSAHPVLMRADHARVMDLVGGPADPSLEARIVLVRPSQAMDHHSTIGCMASDVDLDQPTSPDRGTTTDVPSDLPS